MSRYLVIGALVLVSACSSPADIAAFNKRHDAAVRQREIDEAYDRCISRVVGAFSSASIDVMRECERQSLLPRSTIAKE